MDVVYMTKTFKGDVTSLAIVGWSFVVNDQVVAAVSEVRKLGSTTRVVITLFDRHHQHLLFVNGWKTTPGPSLNNVPYFPNTYVDATVVEDDE